MKEVALGRKCMKHRNTTTRFVLFGHHDVCRSNTEVQVELCWSRGMRLRIGPSEVFSRGNSTCNVVNVSTGYLPALVERT